MRIRQIVFLYKLDFLWLIKNIYINHILVPVKNTKLIYIEKQSGESAFFMQIKLKN